MSTPAISTLDIISIFHNLRVKYSGTKISNNSTFFDNFFIYIGMGHNSHDLAFGELRCKEVVNVIDGKCLGRVNDIVFCRASSKVLGFIVPGDKKFYILKRREDMFIPFDRVCKIGIDVILVEIKPSHHHHDSGNMRIEESSSHHLGHCCNSHKI